MSDVCLSEMDRAIIAEFQGFLNRSANVTSQAAVLAGMIEMNNIRRYQGKAVAYSEDAIESQIKDVINA